MKILIYDIAASESGALTVLKAMYEYAVRHTEHRWVFFVFREELLPGDARSKVEIREFPNVKKSWINRLFFDRFLAPRYIEKVRPDLVINFQNVAILCRTRQFLYLHNAIPFVKYRFSVLDFKLWLYQHFVSKKVYKSCMRVDKIIVQTAWMKGAITRKTNCLSDKIEVRPFLQAGNLATKEYNGEKNKNYFFYPATPFRYKNHKTLFKALNGLDNYTLFLTIKGNENAFSRRLKRIANRMRLNIVWLGVVSHEKMADLYSCSTLVFPSHIETLGLPLLEGKKSNCPIIAADTPWVRETLSNYDRLSLFELDDFLGLRSLIRKSIFPNK